MRPLLVAQNLQKVYGRQTVFSDISFTVLEGQKIALLGRNGAGKSTLLRILSEVEEADNGTVERMPWLRLGVIDQHEVLPADITAEDYLMVKSGKESWEARKMASQFGLKPDDLAKMPSQLSGGYQMRVKLAAMMLKEPTLLLLDEPVNYLDLPTLLLLERFLKAWKGSFVVTSHDREFLQNVATDTFEIDRGEFTMFPGDVETYTAWKEEQRQFVLRTNKRLKREIAHAQDFVNRFRAKASLATRAQSKMKHIAKLTRQLSDLSPDAAKVQLMIPSPHVPPGDALRVKDLVIGYGEKVIASGIAMYVRRGEKVLIAGENGRGKSTLLRTLAGELPKIDGAIQWWHKAEIGYYSQFTHGSLIETETVQEYLARMAPHDASAERILMMAGNFLFRHDDLEKRTSVLSGGERARLCLAGLLLHEYNTLLLDEPTNHLDVETVESLARALKEYKGTVFFVSHARTFVNSLADKIYEVRAGAVRHYTGTYEEYVADLEALAEEDIRGVLADVALKGDSKSAEERAAERLLMKERQRERLRLEKEITKFEKEKSEILAYFFENPTEYAPAKATRLAELNDEIRFLEDRWLSLG